MKTFLILVRKSFMYLNSHVEVYYTEAENAETANKKVSTSIEDERNMLLKLNNTLVFLPFKIVGTKKLKEPLNTYKKRFENQMDVNFIE